MEIKGEHSHVQAVVDAHEEASIDAAIARSQEQRQPLNLDGVDQIVIMDALHLLAEYSREKAEEFKGRGRLILAEARRALADDAERLREVFAHCDTVVVS